MNVTFTPKAEAFMRRMVRMAGAGTAGFRLEVSPGGCSGLAARFDVETEPKPTDSVIEVSRLRVFLSRESCRLLDGATVHFLDTRTESGFSIIAPNATASCSSAAAPPPAVVTIDVRSIRHIGLGESIRG